MDEMNNGMPQQPAPQSGDKKGLAIAALVLGIVSIPLICFPYFSIPCAVLAIIFGALSRKSSGRGMAIAGMVCAIIAIAIDIAIVIFIGSMFSYLGSSSFTY